MDTDYYNIVNQLQLVNNWCVVNKLYIGYVKFNPKYISNRNIFEFYVKHGFNDWNAGILTAIVYNSIELIEIYIYIKGCRSISSMYARSDTIK
jgi:hypothetical protein